MMIKRRRPSKHTRMVRVGRGRKLRKRKTINRHIRKVSIRIPSKIPRNISRSQARIVSDSFVEDISNNLQKGKQVNIPGFGIFKLKKIKAKPRRKGRNPFTGEIVTLKAKPASKKVRFFASKKLKEGI